MPGNSIVGLRPAPTPSIISLNSTQASYGGSQVSIVEEPRPIRPSYASAASVISTGTTQTARQNVPTGMTSSVTSGGKRSVAWVPPHLRGLDTSQRSGAPAGKEAPATVLPLPRPQLRGMAGPNPDTATPHLRGTQPSIASTDSRAGVQSFASSSAASTTGTDAVQPSNSHEYNAFSPLGQMYRQTTGGIPVDGTGTFMSGRKQIKVGRCGWQSGVRYLRTRFFCGTRTNTCNRTIENGSMLPRCSRLPPTNTSNLTRALAATMRCNSLLSAPHFHPLRTLLD